MRHITLLPRHHLIDSLADLTRAAYIIEDDIPLTFVVNLTFGSSSKLLCAFDEMVTNHIIMSFAHIVRPDHIHKFGLANSCRASFRVAGGMAGLIVRSDRPSCFRTTHLLDPSKYLAAGRNIGLIEISRLETSMRRTLFVVVFDPVRGSSSSTFDRL